MFNILPLNVLTVLKDVKSISHIWIFGFRVLMIVRLEPFSKHCLNNLIPFRDVSLI